ncbi:MAG: hypothetical protein ACE145_05210 [Terriglobia bacterium]
MLLAVTIALALTTSELLTKYRSHIFRDFLNLYFFVYLSLNGFFAVLAYLAIPRFSDAVVKGSLEHSLLAGFGYALVLRTKLITITIRGQDFAVGPELLYTGLINYMGFHLANKIQARHDQLRRKLLDAFPDPVLFETALNIKVSEISDAQLRRDTEAARDAILNSKLGPTEKVYGIVKLLLDLDPDERSLTDFLQGIKGKEGKSP